MASIEQRDIWGNILKKESLELYEPEQSAWAANKKELSRYTVPMLEEKANLLKTFLHGKIVTLIDRRGNRKTSAVIQTVVQKKSGNRKADLITFVSIFLAEKRNFILYLSSQPEPVQEMWRKILTDYYASAKTLQDIMKRELVKQDKRGYYYGYWNSPWMDQTLAWFQYRQERTFGKGDFGHDNSDYYFSVPTSLAAMLLPHFFPEMCKPSAPIQELPAGLHTFCAESQIHIELPVMESLYKSNLLEMGKGKIGASALKKAMGMLNAAEFYADSTEKERTRLRAAILLNFYSLFRTVAKNSSGNEAPENLLKQLIPTVVRYPQLLASLLMPHISGFRKEPVMESYLPEQANLVLNLLIRNAADNWFPVDKLCFQLRLNENQAYYTMLFGSQYFCKMELRNDKLLHTIFLDHFYREVSIPYIKGIIFLLAAFGLAEIACRDISEEDVSYFCPVQYVRLTPLGNYVLGMSASYQRPVLKEQKRYFETDAENFIIRSTETVNPYESLLTDIASPIGKQRYRVTPASFLKNCQNLDDIVNKIGLFEQYICPDPPANWKAFFDEMKRHCHPLQDIPTDRYLPFQLRENDRELQRILSTDPILRQYTVRAENYLILVKAQHLKAMKERLKELGYLL